MSLHRVIEKRTKNGSIRDERLISCDVVFYIVVQACKKTSADGKISVYLPKRTFTDKGTVPDPVCGVIQVDPEYLKVS